MNIKLYKHFLVLFSLLVTVAIGCNVYKISSVEKERDGVALAIAQEIKMTKDPQLGTVPKERLLEAKNYADNIRKTRAALSNVNWTELGPKNCGGRTRCVWVDLADATGKTVWVGSVGGGLWKTTDITASVPVWNSVNNFFTNIAITDIAQDPTNTNIMYFSTGEGLGNSDAVRGLGVFKSTDGGATWNQLASTNTANFYYCLKMVVTNTGTVLVSTKTGGLQRSANGGTTFTKVLGTSLGITGATSNYSYDVDVASNGDVYASIDGSVHKSTNDGVTFGSALPLGVTASRVEIACAPNDANYVYCLIESANVVNGIVQTINGGTSFTTKTEPADADTGIPAADFSRTQAWYDLTIAVDPNDKNVLYVGGVDLFKSTNGASTWQQISHWYGGFGFQDVHADQHEILFSPTSSNIIYFVNDGSIYRTDNGTTAIPTLVSKEENYNTTQFYACAIHPTIGNDYYLAGAQDNGTHKLTSGTISNSVEVTGGDGAFCHIDQNEPQYQFTSYVYNNYYMSNDGGASFSSVTSGNTGQFINPTDYDDIANIMYCSHNSGTYLRWDNPQTGATFTSKTIAAFAGSMVSAVKVSPNVANEVFFGLENGSIVRVTNANATTPVASVISTASLPTGANVSCIEVETGNDNHILVTYSNYGVTSIWETTNGGTLWTNIEGNVPDMPIRWILLNPNNPLQALIATELGVWSTDNISGGATVWGASNNGLANVRVDMLQTRVSDKLVIAATHGRGLFYSDVFASPTAKFTSNTQISYVNKSVQFTNTSLQSISYNWDFGDGTTSTAANPLKAYTNPGTYTVSLTINAGASSISKTNYIQILPNRTTPYTIAQGGNFETNITDFGSYAVTGTPFARGNSIVAGKNGTVSASNAWVTGITGNYVNNTESYLYTPNYDFSLGGYYNIKFFTKYIVENQYDGFKIQYSTDKGDTWQPLGNAVQTNWYNYLNNPQVSFVFPFNEAFFSGSFGAAYTQKIMDVSSLAGNANVAFRVQFKADDFSTAAGVAIDNFEILGPLNAPLPVSFKDFTVIQKDEDVEVYWQTEDEKNIASYDVQKSYDGISFDRVTHILATSNAINNYYEIDIKPWATAKAKNTIYYRIKIYNWDKSIEYSDVRAVTNNINEQISVGPVPFDTYIKILPRDNKVNNISVYNVVGQQLYATTLNQDGIYFMPENMPAGCYILHIETNYGTIERKILKK